jgi:L-ascorbate metabolism protein UlaG (beta-lactamase superfamily)
MEIFWLGNGCFRIRGREATVLTDPTPPASGYKIGRVAADLVTISSNSPDSNYRQAVQGETKFVTGPGEYEIAGVLITGRRTNHARDEGEARNVAFVFDIDDVRVCHLGSINHIPSTDDVEILGAADVLLVPIGGNGTLDTGRAAETISVLEPKIVIPMRYKTEAATANLDTVDKFLKEMGAESKKPENRLTITKSTVPSDTSVVLLEYRG